MQTDYCFLGQVIRSDIVFPELEPFSGKSAEVILLKRRELDLTRFDLVHHWQDGDEIQLSCLRSGDDYCLVVPDMLDALVSSSGLQVDYEPSMMLDDASLHHLLLDQVLPRVCSFLGESVIHASCVGNEDGAVAFLGTTGQGKSTIAAAHVAEGFLLLSDDCVRLIDDQPQHEWSAHPETSLDHPVLIEGSYPGIRLDPALGNHFSSTLSPGSAMANYSSKLRYQIGDSSSVRGPLPLRAVFLLTSSAEPSVSSVQGAEAVMALVHETFVLNPMDRQVAEERIVRHSGLLAQGVPVFRLGVPHDLDVMPAVLSLIKDTLVAETGKQKR